MWYWNPRHYLKQLSGPRFYHLSNEWIELYDIRTGYVGGKEEGKTPYGSWGSVDVPEQTPWPGLGAQERMCF